MSHTHYAVNEIFYSLQGEGYFTGTPAVFIRMSGCNLRCSFCDTDHSKSTLLTLSEIQSQINQYPGRHIVITGGEPALQIDSALLDALHAQGCFIQVETNGTHPLPEGIDWITCSPKTSDQGPAATVVLSKIDELKLVYTGQDVEAIAIAMPPAQHYELQPCSGQNTPQTIAYILTHPHWRLSLQTHKILHIR